jgi:hypothetical protein
VTKSVAGKVPNAEQLGNEIKNNVNEALVGFLPNNNQPLVAGAAPAGNQPTPSPVNPAPLLDVSPDNYANGNLFTGGGTDPITSSVDLASAIIDNVGDFGSIASTVAQLPVETVNQVVNGGNLPSGDQIANQVVNGGNLPSGDQIASQIGDNLPSGEEIANQVVDTLVGSAQNLVPTQDDTSNTSNTSNTNSVDAAPEVEVVNLPGGTQFNVGDQTSVLHQLDGGIVSQIQNTASNLDIQQFVELNISIANFTQFLTSGFQKSLANKLNGELSRFGSTLGSN